MRAKFGGLVLPSGVESQTPLFSSDRIPRAERPAGERDCVSSDSRSGGGREHLRVNWYRQVQVGTS
jgi:hypothetical protein